MIHQTKVGRTDAWAEESQHASATCHAVAQTGLPFGIYRCRRDTFVMAVVAVVVGRPLVDHLVLATIVVMHWLDVCSHFCVCKCVCVCACESSECSIRLLSWSIVVE